MKPVQVERFPQEQDRHTENSNDHQKHLEAILEETEHAVVSTVSGFLPTETPPVQ